MTDTHSDKHMQERDNILTGCERSMRYHHARQSFYETSTSFIHFVIFILSAGSVLILIEELFGKNSVVVAALMALVSVLSLFSLVFNPAKKASIHRSLYHEFAMLAADIESSPETLDEKNILNWRDQISIIYSKEPPVYRALNEHCRNQVAIALDNKEEFNPMHWYYRTLRNIFPFQGVTEFSVKKPQS